MMHPHNFAPQVKLPAPRSFEHWRERTLRKMLRQLSQDDFDFAFELVVKWIDGRAIDAAQAEASATDIMFACSGVWATSMIQTCELTGLRLLTVRVKGPDGKVLQRTRRVALKDPDGLEDLEPPLVLTKKTKPKRA